ncbi:winged helix-turn-helix transcriptional regulator [candidate division KSB1 bacterium]|nr:winged helix-turn-helix transcriptional regulator [candidate division KSB1 bacterium]
MDSLIKIFKALGDKSRLRILKMLQIRQLCVCEMTTVLGLATSTVSNHLSILKEAGLIFDIKDGKWVDYSINTQSSSLFITGLLPLLSFWLNDDEQIQMDAEKLKTAYRNELCR